MECPVQSDLQAFPGCDIVRIGSECWGQNHTAALDRIMEGVEVFLHDHSHLPFEKLVKAYEQNEPRARVGNHHVFVLYGPLGAFYVDNGELKTDIKGLVYKPMIARRKKGKIIAEF